VEGLDVGDEVVLSLAVAEKAGDEEEGLSKTNVSKNTDTHKAKTRI